MKTFLVATLVVGSLGAGTALIAAVTPLGIAGAQTSPSTTVAPAPAEKIRPIDSVLDGLVADGTLTQQQADAVKSRLAEFREAHRPIRYAVKDFLGTAASTIGIEPKDLVKELRGGKSIADVAAEHGVAEQGVIDAVVSSLSSQLDRAVANGAITAERAAEVKAKLPARVEHLVEAKRGVHRSTTTTTG